MGIFSWLFRSRDKPQNFYHFSGWPFVFGRSASGKKVNELTSFIFRETAMIHLLLWGNSYSQIIRDGMGRVVGLYPLLPDRMSVDRDEHGKIVKSIKARHAKSERLDGFAQALTAQSGSVTEFDEGLWGTLVDFMTVYSKEDISVTFKDGTEIHMG